MNCQTIKQYIVDAFSHQIFHGNPAAVCILERWLSDEQMTAVAKENNLSETAFILKDGKDYQLRWFTPGGEIDLCGHATLAAASVLMSDYEPDRTEISFRTMGGILHVKKEHNIYQMNFPTYDLKPLPVTEQMIEAIGACPAEAYIGRDLLCVFTEESTVQNMSPDLNKVEKLDGLLLQVTAPGKDFDCVSRSFAPKLNVPEDL